MQAGTLTQVELDPGTRTFYRGAMTALRRAKVPFLVGGAYALGRYTGIVRHTKDFDVFVRPSDGQRALDALAAVGYGTELTYPHWLGKAYSGDDFVDVIFSSGNKVAIVDEAWFAHAVAGKALGLAVLFCPVEEMIWSKSFVLERERYDGADIIHLLRACGPSLEWRRLLQRFGPDWRVLLSHVVLFGYAYPAERTRIPDWVVQELLARVQAELSGPAAAERICQGTLLSREQYLIDIERWGYQDARLPPRGNMTKEEIAHWTAAIYVK